MRLWQPSRCSWSRRSRRGASSRRPSATTRTRTVEVSHQHKTQVEPDSFAFGQTIVALTQSGRWYGGGGSSNLVFSIVAERRAHVDDRRPPRNHGELRRSMAADQRSVDRVRRPGRRLACARARHRLRRGRPHPARQPLDRRRCDLVESGHRRRIAREPSGTRPGSRCDNWASEPALRQLLHRVRRQRRRQPGDDGHLDRRWADVGLPSQRRCRRDSAASRCPCRTARSSSRIRPTTSAVFAAVLDGRRRTRGPDQLRREPVSTGDQGMRDPPMPSAEVDSAGHASTWRGRTAVSSRAATRTTSC